MKLLLVGLMTNCLIIFQLYAQSISNPVKQCQYHYDMAEYKQALSFCRQAAEQNDSQSQTILGEILDNGSGGVIDQAGAKVWWQKAARQNNLEAENFLALKYYYGGTIFEQQPFWPQDFKKAMQLWNKGAKRGVPASQFMLAELYRLGQGTQIDLSNAYAWYKLAMDGKYGLAQELLHEILKQMTANDMEKGEKIYFQLKKDL